MGKGRHSGDSMGVTENAGFSAEVQRIARIYPWLDRLLSCLLAKRQWQPASAETQTIQLPSLYARRSVMPFAVADPQYGRLVQLAALCVVVGQNRSASSRLVAMCSAAWTFRRLSTLEVDQCNFSATTGVTNTCSWLWPRCPSRLSAFKYCRAHSLVCCKFFKESGFTKRQDLFSTGDDWYSFLKMKWSSGVK